MLVFPVVAVVVLAFGLSGSKRLQIELVRLRVVADDGPGCEARGTESSSRPPAQTRS